MIDLPRDIRATLSRVLPEGEEILWAGRPVAKHAWTALAPSDANSRCTRAVLVAVAVIMSAAVVVIGLMLFLAAFAVLSDSPSRVGGIIGLLLLVSVGVVLMAVGAFGIARPRLTIRQARDKVYVLTSRQAIVAWDRREEVNLERFDLARIWPVRAERVLECGVGDIVLDHRQIRLVGGDSDISFARVDQGFFAVSDAANVAERIETQRLLRAEEWKSETGDEIEQRRAQLFGR